MWCGMECGVHVEQNDAHGWLSSVVTELHQCEPCTVVAANHGMRVCFTKSGCRISNSRNKLIMQAEGRNNIYSIHSGVERRFASGKKRAVHQLYIVSCQYGIISHPHCRAEPSAHLRTRAEADAANIAIAATRAAADAANTAIAAARADTRAALSPSTVTNQPTAQPARTPSPSRIVESLVTPSRGITWWESASRQSGDEHREHHIDGQGGSV